MVDDDVMVAVAGLKVPDANYREGVFAKAGAGDSSARFPLEAGWFFVTPHYRGRAAGKEMLDAILRVAADHGVFATTRIDNVGMQSILAYGHFSAVGRPYESQLGGHELVLYVREPIAPTPGEVGARGPSAIPSSQSATPSMQ